MPDIVAKKVASDMGKQVIHSIRGLKRKTLKSTIKSSRGSELSVGSKRSDVSHKKN